MTGDQIGEVFKLIVGLWPKGFNAAQLEAIRPHLEPLPISTDQARAALQQMFIDGVKFSRASEVVARLRKLRGGNSKAAAGTRDPRALLARLLTWAEARNVPEFVTLPAARERYAGWIDLARANFDSIVGTNLVPDVIRDDSADFGQLSHLLDLAGVPRA